MNGDNPFVGPRPFEANEIELFFGREHEAKSLLSLVLSQRVVLFFAPSGAGKSSLINTRLIPGLQEEGFYVFPVGRVKGSERAIHDHTANIFTYNLLSSISRESKHEVPTFLSIAGFLEDDTASRIYLQKPERRKALIIDQFEEIVTSHLEHWQQRKDLFDQLRQGLNVNPLLWLILVMREDYVANLEPYASLLPGRLQTRFYMPRMDARGALEATKGPAEKGGRAFAPGVAEELVDNLRQIHTEATGERRLGEYIEPVQLQVVCRQLWAKLSSRNSNIISADDLKDLGDIDTALAQFYDGAVQAVAGNSGIPELTIRNWFEEELITETGTRSLVYEGPEHTAGLYNEAVQELADRYLIRADTRPGGTWYELVHDRFLAPIHRSNRDWLLLQNPILQDAYAWDRSGRDGSYLYQGGRLESALEAIKEHSPDPLISEFLDAGTGEQQHQELAQRAATAQRDRRLLVGAGLLLSIAVMLSLLLWGTQQVAVQNAELARTAQAEADQNRATIAEQVIVLQDSLVEQARLLEEQKVLISGETPTSFVESTNGTASISNPTVSITEGTPSTSSPTNAPDSSAEFILQARATQTSVAIDNQLARVRATQTIIAITSTPPPLMGPLIGITPPRFRLQAYKDVTRNEPLVIIEDVHRLPVVEAQEGMVRLLTPSGEYGWVNGRFLIFEGDRSLLSPELRYRVISDRNRPDLPFVYGKVTRFADVTEIPLLAEPGDLQTVITSLPVETEVTVLLNVSGDPSFGSGRWYLVDTSADGWFWSGYLPVEAVMER